MDRSSSRTTTVVGVTSTSIESDIPPAQPEKIRTRFCLPLYEERFRVVGQETQKHKRLHQGKSIVGRSRMRMPSQNIKTQDPDVHPQGNLPSCPARGPLEPSMAVNVFDQSQLHGRNSTVPVLLCITSARLVQIVQKTKVLRRWTTLPRVWSSYTCVFARRQETHHDSGSNAKRILRCAFARPIIAGATCVFM